MWLPLSLLLVEETWAALNGSSFDPERRKSESWEVCEARPDGESIEFDSLPSTVGVGRVLSP